MRLLLFIVCAGIIGGGFLVKCGRSIWMPAKLKLMGKRTTEEVVETLRPKMMQQYPVAELTDGRPLALLAFKEERRLELWKKGVRKWRLIKVYPFTGYSGSLGPKLAEGDRQIPEGVYDVEYLNPNSSYHLSIKLNYPNAFDRSKAELAGRNNLGGDIFIHGSHVTIGCIPLGDDAIEEVFFFVAANGTEHCRIIVAPRDFRKIKSWPDIPSLNWEQELYAKIAEALVPFGQCNDKTPQEKDQ